MRVRTAVVPPFGKGSREKGDDYFGSLLPSLQLLFGLLLMPAGFSEEVCGGGKQEGEEEEYKLLGHHSQRAGRAMSRNPHSYRGLGHCAAQTAGRERQQPVQTDSSLLLSTRGGERVQYSTALGQRGHLSGPENMPHLSPRTGLTFHWGEGFSHPVLGAGRATPPPLHKQEGQEWIFLS